MKRIPVLLLTALLLLSLLPLSAFAAELPFRDIEDNRWSHDEIVYVYENGLMNGVLPDVFRPRETCSRAMLLTVLYRIEGSPEAEPCDLADVISGTYYYDAICWAVSNGIVKGYADGNFYPASPVTREEMATLIYRYAIFKEYNMDARKSEDYLAFPDAEQIQSYARNSFAWCYANGLLKGTEKGLLNPAATTTREQLAAILMRLCEDVAKAQDAGPDAAPAVDSAVTEAPAADAVAPAENGEAAPAENNTNPEAN